jgi:hypothetical protein
MYVGQRRRRHGFDGQSAAGPGASDTPQPQKAPVVAICAEIEAEIAELDDADKRGCS